MKNISTTQSIENCPGNGQLSNKSLILLIALLSSFPALSTDLYMPALPTMSDQLGAPVAMVNLTLILFFVFLSISALFWGPMSDKYGRKKVLLTTLPIYIIASLFCVISGTVYQLITARIFQAIGAGASTAVTLAIIKDAFPGKTREKAIALVSIIGGVGPIIAPSIGAQIVRLINWRGSFVLLAIVGCLSFIFVLFLKETNKEPTQLSIPRTTLKLFTVLRNVQLTKLVLIFGLRSFAGMSFISISSFIFIKRFGLSEEIYSIYFGCVAMCFAIGGPLYLVLTRYVKALSILSSSFVMIGVGGILILLVGGLHPALFAAAIAVSFIASSTSGPPANSLLLEQQDKDIGSTSSVINSVFIGCGSMGMLFISFDWSDRIFVMGLMNVCVGFGGYLLWKFAKKGCRIPGHFLSTTGGEPKSLRH